MWIVRHVASRHVQTLLQHRAHTQLTYVLSDMLQTHKELVAGVLDLAGRVQADKQLTALIRRKFAIKCTTGYSLNALVDFSLDDPIEIIKRLMIGSEGTFGFVSEATYNCVPEWPHKVSPLPLVNVLCICITAYRRLRGRVSTYAPQQCHSCCPLCCYYGNQNASVIASVWCHVLPGIHLSQSASVFLLAGVP